MKVFEQSKAIKLRKEGVAMGEIARQLKVAKSSVSYWVRDVRISKKKLRQLKSNSYSIDAIEKRRSARIANTDKRRKEVRIAATSAIEQMSKNPLWYVGVALYWGEGGKTKQTPRVANSDPAVISIMMKFFRQVCKVPEHKFRGHVHAFEHTSVDKVEIYWSQVSGIPCDRFYKTYIKKSVASKDKRQTLPYGTFQIYVHDTDLFFTLMTWIEHLKKM